uniref:T-box domain-containing protein n=1 Tax=Caenorhabditis japonica TaxID=281687 RepID=A0A8R1IQM3_CAEJA
MHSSVQVTLANREDYLQFYPMLLNEQCLKSTGRQLHPAPRFVLSNLEPNSEYTMSVQFRKTSGFQWQYSDNEWRPVGSKENPVNEKAPEIQHPDGARFGARWNQNDTSFNIRLTNKSSTAELVGLTSLCKYMIVLVIRQMLRQPDGQYAEHGDPLEFLFPETEFIAVSRYYDPRVSDIKSATNKFSSRNAKRKRSLEEQERSAKRKCSEPVTSSEFSPQHVQYCCDWNYFNYPHYNNYYNFNNCQSSQSFPKYPPVFDFYADNNNSWENQYQYPSF